MVRHQAPCLQDCIAFTDNLAQSFYKVVSISIVLENISAFNTSRNNMVQGAWCIDAGFSWHEVLIAEVGNFINIEI